MDHVSRRKFLKWALAASMLLNGASILHFASDKQPEVVLSIDKDGNASLHGVTLVVTKRGEATIRKDRG